MNKVNCPWCISSRLEPNAIEGTVRVYTCLDCGTVTKATIVVNLRALLGLCKNNKKVTAIKLHRFNTGAGLREAKDFIEELMKYE